MLVTRSLPLVALSCLCASLWLVACEGRDHDPGYDNVPPLTNTGMGGGSGGSGTGGGLVGEVDWALSAGDADGDQYAYDVAVDSQGAIIITGDFAFGIDFGGALDGGSGGIYLVKLDSAGQFLWGKGFDTGKGLSVAVDGSDNIWLLGTFGDDLDLGCGSLPAGDLFLAKFDTDGACLFSRAMGPAGFANQEYNAYDAAVAPDGNLVISGRYTGTPDFGGGPLEAFGASDVFIAAYDADGAHRFSHGFGDETDQTGLGLAVSADAIVLTGRSDGSVDFGGGVVDSQDGGDAFVVSFDPDGNHSWSKSFDNAGSQDANVALIDPSSGDIIVAGDMLGSCDFGGGDVNGGGGVDFFIARFDAAGEHLWSHAYGDDFGQYLVEGALDSDRNIVVIGLFQGDLGIGNPMELGGGVFLAKLSPDGVGRYVNSWSADAALGVNSVATDGLDVVAVGDYKGTLQIGESSYTSLSPDAFDVWVARIAFE